MPLADAYHPNFQYAVEQTLLAEGGAITTDHDWDPGGLTKYGITQKNHPEVDVRNLTKEQAVDIYYRKYWLAPGIHRLDSKYVAAEVFDTAVNMGPVAAAKIAQQAVNFLSFPDVLTVDGRIGPASAEAINKLSKKHELALVIALNTFQGIRYVQICRDNPTLHKAAARGLMKRLAIPKELLT